MKVGDKVEIVEVKDSKAHYHIGDIGICGDRWVVPIEGSRLTEGGMCKDFYTFRIVERED